jgi:hypothetical protein
VEKAHTYGAVDVDAIPTMSERKDVPRVVLAHWQSFEDIPGRTRRLTVQESYKPSPI